MRNMALSPFAFPIVAALLLSGCVHPHIQPQETPVQRAHEICLQYGATPGTGPFYRCMKSQMRKELYNHAVSSCTTPGSQSYIDIQDQCNQSAIGSPNYWQQVGDCKQRLTARCERQASDEYLQRNDAQRIKVYNHNYNHNYGG